MTPIGNRQALACLFALVAFWFLFSERSRIYAKYRLHAETHQLQVGASDVHRAKDDFAWESVRIVYYVLARIPTQPTDFAH